MSPPEQPHGPFGDPDTAVDRDGEVEDVAVPEITRSWGAAS